MGLQFLTGSVHTTTDVQSATMKVALLFLAVFFVSANGAIHVLESLIRKEVYNILRTDPDLNVNNCYTKCDALFDLIAPNDERMVDQLCENECKCQINHTCVTHQPHHTHPTTMKPNHQHHTRTMQPPMTAMP